MTDPGLDPSLDTDPKLPFAQPPQDPQAPEGDNRTEAQKKVDAALRDMNPFGQAPNRIDGTL